MAKEGTTYEGRRKGEEAEGNFVNWAKEKGIRIDRYGFDNSPIGNKFMLLPKFVRFTPDYICYGNSPFLVECKGTGGNGIFAAKTEPMEFLHEWDTICKLYLFIWDSAKKRVCFMAFSDLVQLIAEKQYVIDFFQNKGGKEYYYRVPHTDLKWTAPPKKEWTPDGTKD